MNQPVLEAIICHIWQYVGAVPPSRIPPMPDSDRGVIAAVEDFTGKCCGLAAGKQAQGGHSWRAHHLSPISGGRIVSAWTRGKGLALFRNISFHLKGSW
jgi:hypothetical protein